MRKLTCLCLATALCLIALPTLAGTSAGEQPTEAASLDLLFQDGSCDAPAATPAAEPATVEVTPEPLFLGGTPCGDVFCGKGQWCCNASCNRCVPIGIYCTQESCV